MGAVGGAAVVGGLDEHAGVATGIGFPDIEVVSSFKFLQMGTEVSIGELQELLERGKVDRVTGREGAERCHDAKAHRLVDKGVEFFHGRVLT